MLRCFCLAVEVSLMNFAMRLFVNFKKNIQTFKKFMFAQNMSISVKIMKIIYWTITKKPTFQTNAKVQENSLTPKETKEWLIKVIIVCFTIMKTTCHQKENGQKEIALIINHNQEQNLPMNMPCERKRLFITFVDNFSKKV